MQKMTLDFVAPPYTRWPGVVVLLMGLVLAGLGWRVYQQAEQQALVVTKALTAERSGQQPANKSQAKRVLSPEQEEDLHRVQQISDFLLLPWGDLFAALESLDQEDVALLAIEPDPKKRLVRITAEAKNEAAMFDYLEQMADAPQLQDVHLLRHEIRQEDKQHPLRFTIGAYWKVKS